MAYTLTREYTVPAANAQLNGRSASAITGFIVHHWGVKGQKFNDVKNFLTRPRPAAPTSASAVLEAGRVVEITPDTTVTYHAGNWAGNITKYGIECRPECTDGDVDTLVEYIVDKARALKLTSFTIEGHRDYSATACPGDYYARLPEIINRVNAALTGAPASAPTEEGKEWSEMATEKEIENAAYRGAKNAMNELLDESFTRKGAIAEKKWGKNTTNIRAIFHWFDEAVQSIYGRLDRLEELVKGR